MPQVPTVSLDPGAALALGELETGGLFFALFVSAMAARRAALRWPRLVSWRPGWSLAALLGAEAAFLLWGALNASPNPPAWASSPGGPLFAVAPVPLVGGVWLSNIGEGLALTAFCLWRGQGTLRVALYVLPLWYGFHDGLYFLLFDLWGGYVPFVYTAMLAPFPAAYFGQFLVDMWQALSVALVARALWRRRHDRPALAGAGALAAAWGAALLLAGPLGSTLVPVSASVAQWVPNSFRALYAYGGLPYMALYTPALYLLLRPAPRGGPAP